MAKHSLSYSDNEVQLIGTSKLNVMDATNIENVREALREMSENNVERNQWILVRVYDPLVQITHTGV